MHFFRAGCVIKDIRIVMSRVMRGSRNDLGPDAVLLLLLLLLLSPLLMMLMGYLQSRGKKRGKTRELSI